MLVDIKIEEHVHAVAFITEEPHIVSGRHIGFAQKHDVTFTPLQKIAKVRQVFIVPDMSFIRLLRLDEEGNCIDSKSGYPKLEPKTHYSLDFIPDCRILQLEVCLKVI